MGINGTRLNRNKNNLIFKITVTAMLAALGSALMVVGTFLVYPVVPFLKLEPSDTVILVAYAISGWWSALLCAVIKAGLNIMILGPSGPYGIGEISAIIASLSYVVGLFICSNVLHLFKKGIKGRIASYAIIISIVTAIMTLANYLFITPTYLSGTFDTCFSAKYQGDVFFDLLPFKGNFFFINFAVYFPFNLLKGAIVCALYEIIFNRLIFQYVKKSEKKTVFGNNFWLFTFAIALVLDISLATYSANKEVIASDLFNTNSWFIPFIISFTTKEGGKWSMISFSQVVLIGSMVYYLFRIFVERYQHKTISQAYQKELFAIVLMLAINSISFLSLSAAPLINSSAFIVFLSSNGPLMMYSFVALLILVSYRVYQMIKERKSLANQE